MDVRLDAFHHQRQRHIFQIKWYDPLSPTKKSSVGQDYPPLGTSSHAWVSSDMWLGYMVSMLDIPSSVPMLAIPRNALHLAGEDHPVVQDRLGCTTLVMALQKIQDVAPRKTTTRRRTR